MSRREPAVRIGPEHCMGCDFCKTYDRAVAFAKFPGTPSGPFGLAICRDCALDVVAELAAMLRDAPVPDAPLGAAVELIERVRPLLRRAAERVIPCTPLYDAAKRWDSAAAGRSRLDPEQVVELAVRGAVLLRELNSCLDRGSPLAVEISAALSSCHWDRWGPNPARLAALVWRGE